MPALRVLLLVLVAARLLVRVAPADILDTVAGVFDAITSIPGDAVRAVWSAIKGVFDFFTHLGTVLDSAWDWMVNGIEWLGSRAVWLGSAVFNTTAWLVTRWVPMAAHWALGKAVAFTIGAWKEVEHWVTGLVNGVVKFLRGLIHDVEKWARAAFRAVTHELGKIIKWVAEAGRYVFGILAHPGRLVAWILPDLLVPLVKFIVSKSAPVIRWLIGAFVHLAPELATTIESALAKIL